MWCKTSDFKSAIIFYNQYFSEDPLYNHATKIELKNGDILDVIKKVSNFFNKKKINPCFYVPKYEKSGTFLKLLTINDFKLYDEMIFLELARSTTNLENDRIKIISMNEEMSIVWSNVFFEAFKIPDSWHTEVIKIVKKIASQENTILLLAYLDDQPVGVCALYSKDSIGGLYCLGTIPSHRNKGVASALIKKAIARSKLIGNKTLCLQTLDQDRLENFYWSRGFRKIFKRDIYSKP